jgi:hypothetical protein
MNFRLLSLCVVCLGLVAGCAKQSSSPEAPMSDPSQPTQTDSPSGGTPITGAAGQGEAVVYTVRNSGIRCIAPPCPTHVAVPVNDPNAEGIQIHEIDFQDMNPTEEKREEYMGKADTAPEGLKVEAVLEKKLNAGPAGDATVLRVKKVLQ